MKSKRSKRKKMREFGKLRPYEYNNQMNYLKNLDVQMKRFRKENNLNYTFMVIMLFAYDLEFWTADYIAEQMNRSSTQVKKMFIYPAMKQGLVYKHFDKLSPSKMSQEEQLFYEESKMSYRVRYALTQKSRLLIQSFYRSLE